MTPIPPPGTATPVPGSPVSVRWTHQNAALAQAEAAVSASRSADAGMRFHLLFYPAAARHSAGLLSFVFILKL